MNGRAHRLCEFAERQLEDSPITFTGGRGFKWRESVGPRQEKQTLRSKRPEKGPGGFRHRAARTCLLRSRRGYSLPSVPFAGRPRATEMDTEEPTTSDRHDAQPADRSDPGTVRTPSYVHSVHSPGVPPGHGKTATRNVVFSLPVHVSNANSILTRSVHARPEKSPMFSKKKDCICIGHVDAVAKKSSPSSGFSVSSANRGEWTLWTCIREVIL
jgi:hypothetical protein